MVLGQAPGESVGLAGNFPVVSDTLQYLYLTCRGICCFDIIIQISMNVRLLHSRTALMILAVLILKVHIYVTVNKDFMVTATIVRVSC